MSNGDYMTVPYELCRGVLVKERRFSEEILLIHKVIGLCRCMNLGLAMRQFTNELSLSSMFVIFTFKICY